MERAESRHGRTGSGYREDGESGQGRRRGWGWASELSEEAMVEGGPRSHEECSGASSPLWGRGKGQETVGRGDRREPHSGTQKSDGCGLRSKCMQKGFFNFARI